MKRFFHAIGHFFNKLFGGTAPFGAKVLGVLRLLAPLVQTIVALTGNEAAAAAIGAIMGEVQNDFSTLAALVNSANTTSPGFGDQVAAVLGSVKNNLNELLAAGHIKDANTLAKVQAIANTIIAELQVIVTELPQTTQATAASGTTAQATTSAVPPAK